MACKSVLLFEGEGIHANKYFLIENDCSEKPVYGIKIESDEDFDYDNGVSESKNEVVELIEKFFRLDVSPLHLTELIDDYIA